jgi:uncharacterized protein YwqG
MISIHDSVLMNLKPDVRVQFEQAVAVMTVSTPALVYKPGSQLMSPTSSHLGGQPFTTDFDWPVDKNRKPMVFWAQVNLENLKFTSPQLPNHGMLLLFLSEDYTSFRPKDQSWYRVVYLPNPETMAINAEASHDSNWSAPTMPLFFEQVEYLLPCDAEQLATKAPLFNTLSSEERAGVLNWFSETLKRSAETINQSHQFCCTYSEPSHEACIIASFHANGITFDQLRKADGHYKHLVDAATEWVVFWKLGGLECLLPREKRQLFICIHQKNLEEFDFSKCAAIFL